MAELDAESRAMARRKFQEVMGTSFILDILRDKNQKKNCMKRDAAIRKMALEQKANRSKKSVSGHSQFEPNSFIGMHELMNISADQSPQFHWKRRRSAELAAKAAAEQRPINKEKRVSKTQTELWILGIVQDEKNRTRNIKHHIDDHSCSVPSDEMVRLRFDR